MLPGSLVDDVDVETAPLLADATGCAACLVAQPPRTARDTESPAKTPAFRLTPSKVHSATRLGTTHTHLLRLCPFESAQPRDSHWNKYLESGRPARKESVAASGLLSPQNANS